MCVPESYVYTLGLIASSTISDEHVKRLATGLQLLHLALLVVVGPIITLPHSLLVSYQVLMPHHKHL